MVPETSNGAFCVSYAESKRSCKFELNPASLDFNRFEVSKNPIFHNSSERPQMVRFVLVTLRPAQICRSAGSQRNYIETHYLTSQGLVVTNRILADLKSAKM